VPFSGHSKQGGDNMGYTKALCMFIDILGTKEKSFEELLEINKKFHQAFNEMKKLIINFPGYIASFSDCAYMVLDMAPFMDIEIYILRLLDIISRMVKDFIFNGFIFRGGISLGEVYYDNNKNILFGPALTNLMNWKLQERCQESL
jgi:hypothetical protein